MKCFYHSDIDGKMSAAIVRKAMGANDRLDEFIPMNYNIPFPIEKIGKGDHVVIVDFSISPEDMEKLLELTSNIIWIDHHKTAIDKLAKFDYVSGVRESGRAACELTWEYYFHGTLIPRVVELAADYDVWTFKFGDDAKDFQTGIRLENTHPTSDMWDVLLLEDFDPSNIIENGRVITKYNTQVYRSYCKAWGFFTTFENLKCFACNHGSVSSIFFEGIKEDYDVSIAYVFDGLNYVVSLYAKNKEIDVSWIALKYGGGGHKGASGFVCKELPFKLEKKYSFEKKFEG